MQFTQCCVLPFENDVFIVCQCLLLGEWSWKRTNNNACDHWIRYKNSAVLSDCVVWSFLSREDIRTANVIAAEAVTCLVIDREWVLLKQISTEHNDPIVFFSIDMLHLGNECMMIVSSHAKPAHKSYFSHYVKARTGYKSAAFTGT